VSDGGAQRGHEWQYNPRVATGAEGERYRARASALSAATRATLDHVADVPYGAHPDQIVDIFPARPGAPAHLFLHGGYWRGRDKADYSFLAEPLVASGVTALVANYALCPAVRVADIVRQTVECLQALPRLAAAHQFDAKRVTASGHSAGAHLLAAAVMGETSRQSVSGRLRHLTLVAGIYDLEPVLGVSVNDIVRLRSDDVAGASPQRMSPVADLPIDVVVGARESPGMIVQSARFAQMCQVAGAPVELLVVEREHHFSIMEQYAHPDSDLFRRLLQRCDVAPAA
jgi:arylformamidase